jgi:hypothetical protein
MVLCLSAVIRQNTNTHLEALIKEKDHLASKCKTMEQGIKTVPDLISIEPEAIVKKCQSSWTWFRQYIHNVGEYVAAHVLGMVRSHYPRVDLKRLKTGVSNNTN